MGFLQGVAPPPVPARPPATSTLITTTFISSRTLPYLPLPPSPHTATPSRYQTIAATAADTTHHHDTTSSTPSSSIVTTLTATSPSPSIASAPRVLLVYTAGRSPTASVSLSSPFPGELSYARADLLPSPMRIRSSELATDLEGCSEDSFEPYEEIDKCIAYADALRDKRIDARVVVDIVDRDEIETGVIGLVERDQGHRIIAIGQQSTHMLKRIGELERVNMILRDMMDVASQRVTRSQRRELRVQRELRQIWHSIFSNRMRISRLEACDMRHLGYRS
nr:hypothetical protein [Tanacetum cinerariifolium]